MRLSDFDYQLPNRLIAQAPLERRTSSRLLCVQRSTGALSDRHFEDVLDLLSPGDLLVMNNTSVIKARLYARKSTGARVEILVERIIEPYRALVLLRSNKALKPGAQLVVGEEQLEIVGRRDVFYELRFTHEVLQVLEAHGHTPLPPYIHRIDTYEDAARYQTVYATVPGAVAAPTAGLHIAQDLLDRLVAKGVSTAYVTLHVGAGTFQPVRVEDIERHRMHSEYAEVSGEVCDAVRDTRRRGAKVVAVGTTTVRALESAAVTGVLKPFCEMTSIFIYPGFEFRCVDAIITNFHLPKSTLMMLVCAFAGTQCVLDAYRHAVDLEYRFFSYGDAMLLT